MRQRLFVPCKPSALRLAPHFFQISQRELGGAGRQWQYHRPNPCTPHAHRQRAGGFNRLHAGQRVFNAQAGADIGAYALGGGQENIGCRLGIATAPGSAMAPKNVSAPFFRSRNGPFLLAEAKAIFLPAACKASKSGKMPGNTSSGVMAAIISI